MSKRDLSSVLKQRAAEAGIAPVAVGDTDDATDRAYASLFGGALKPEGNRERRAQSIPLDSLIPFRTAKIGFKPYHETNLRALASDIEANGLIERIKVRRQANGYEILSGHNRVAACRALGWTEIAADVVDADDERAIVIATVTNLQRRQGLLPSERGWAYRALLEAQKRQGKRTDLKVGTSVEIQQKLDARSEIARFFDVKPHDVQRDIRLTHLIPPLLDAVDEHKLNLMCGVQISYYDVETQQLFLERLKTDDWKLTTAVMNRIKRDCPPPSASAKDLGGVWNEASAQFAQRKYAPRIMLDRKRFAPYSACIPNQKQLEELFFEFLAERFPSRQ